MSRRVRLLVVPAILLAAVSGAVYALAQAHPAKPDQAAASPAPAGASGDASAGAALFAENCASCHGENGAGGGIGPTLAGNDISIDDAQATIENGRGVMPADLVSGRELVDVLAYLETILGR